MAGRFDNEFAYTPIGTVELNGQQVQWELINIFRYTDGGRLVEEWVQTDTYDFLRQLGALGSCPGWLEPVRRAPGPRCGSTCAHWYGPAPRPWTREGRASR